MVHINKKLSMDSMPTCVRKDCKVTGLWSLPTDKLRKMQLGSLKDRKRRS